MSTVASEEGGNAVPSPLTVGKLFVKQYYQVLQTSTDQIHRFYQPSSLLSDAVGSTPTDPSGLDNYEIAGRWGIIGGETKGFAMEIGAIDAQTSINNSILLVVTGSVSLSQVGSRKTFTHTFFLTYIPNTKRFYVANDVLRFFEEKQDVIEETMVAKEEESPIEEPVELEKPISETHADSPSVPESEELSPGGGVEESKEIEEDDAIVLEAGQPLVVDPVVEGSTKTEVKKESKPDGKEGGRGKRGKGKAGQQAKQQPTSKPAPGSWASLVASSPPVVSTPVPPSPARTTRAEKTETVQKAPGPVVAPPAKEKETTSKEKGVQQRHKRDPDSTLVLKNLPDGAKDSELVALFEGFATSTGGKILGTTVSVHRGLGFVDFDSVPPVMAAVSKHKESPIELNGRVLEVEQKTAEQKARRNKVGSPNQSGPPGNGSEFRGGNGGRGNQFRRDNKGRGDRGGKGRGNGGSGNTGE